MKKNSIALSSLIAFLFPAISLAACTNYDVPQRFQDVLTDSVNAEEITSLDTKKMWGKTIRIANTDSHKRLLLDTEECSVLAYNTMREAPVKTIIQNVWRDPGSATGAPEIVNIFSTGEDRYDLVFHRVNSDFEMKKIERISVESSTVPTLSVSDLPKIKINGKKYVVGRAKKKPIITQRKKYGFFLTLGDPGLYGESKEEVAAGMATVSRRFNGAQRVLTTGDNFYPENTIETAQDTDYQRNFSDFYVRDWLRVPFLISLGNHDYDDNVLSAILALHDRYTKWHLPDNYYSYTYPKNSAQPLVQFFVLDTEMLDNGDEGTITQLDWLDQQLDQSDARWKILVGHHSPYSYGMHGDNSTIKELVVPIARAHNADAFITGHDHDLQLLNHPDDDIAYVINGAGSTLRDTSSGAMSEFAASEYGFVGIHLRRSTMNILFFDAQGNVLHTKKITR